MLKTISYTRPLFEHQICESTIHSSHLETIHLRALQIICYYFNKIGMDEKLKAAKSNQLSLV